MILQILLFIIVGYKHCAKCALFLQLPELNFQDIMSEQILLGALNSLSPNKNAGPLIPDALDLTFELEDVTFNLFTNDNPDDAYLLKVGDAANLKGSPFKSQVSTKIIIHGWTDSAKSNWIKDFRHNYLMTRDYNVICVDWFPASTKEYSVAVKLTRQVGEVVGDLIIFLKLESGISLSNIHILGHSLGAHIAGFAGSKLSGAVGRITGMDPARPLFESPILKAASDRLDSLDAAFVDVIHTCAGSVGFTRSIGHVDFYPNGGICGQPGCPIFGPQSISCSHEKSYIYMMQSIIYPEQFQAIKCDSWLAYNFGNCLKNARVTMGEYISHEVRGTYYLHV